MDPTSQTHTPLSGWLRLAGNGEWADFFSTNYSLSPPPFTPSTVISRVYIARYLQLTDSLGFHPSSVILAQIPGSRYSNPAVIQIILSTAHPAKFNEAVTKALESSKAFDFERDVLPEEFKGLLEKERKVIQVEGSDPELTKKVIVEQIGEMHQDKIKQNSTASV